MPYPSSATYPGSAVYPGADGVAPSGELYPGPTIYPGAALYPGGSSGEPPPDPTDAFTRWATRVAAGELDVLTPVGYAPVSSTVDTDGHCKPMLGFDLSFELAAGSGAVVVSSPAAISWLDYSPHMVRL